MKDLQDIFITAGEVKKPKKGQGLGKILQLIQDLNDFQAKVEVCVEAQDLAENKQKIQEFLPQIDKMYEILFNMAQSDVRSIRQEHKMPVDEMKPATQEQGSDFTTDVASPLSRPDMPQAPRF